MRELVEGIDPAIEIYTVSRRSSDPEGLAIIRGADMIVGCVDRSTSVPRSTRSPGATLFRTSTSG
jgi:hypothetical protein